MHFAATFLAVTRGSQVITHGAATPYSQQSGFFRRATIFAIAVITGFGEARYIIGGSVQVVAAVLLYTVGRKRRLTHRFLQPLPIVAVPNHDCDNQDVRRASRSIDVFCPNGRGEMKPTNKSLFIGEA
jgi:hypothetical protein